MQTEHFTLGRVVEAIDRLTDTIDRFAKTQDDHGTRIGKLEQKGSWLAGVWAGACAVAAYVGAKLGVL